MSFRSDMCFSTAAQSAIDQLSSVLTLSKKSVAPQRQFRQYSFGRTLMIHTDGMAPKLHIFRIGPPGSVKGKVPVEAYSERCPPEAHCISRYFESQ